MHMYGPHTCPRHRAHRLALAFLRSTVLLQQRSSPPTSLHGKGHGGHMTCYFEEDLVDAQSRPSTIQLHPREMRHICWTPLEWYSVSLRAIVKIRLRVYDQLRTRINRCPTSLITPAVLDCYIQRRQLSFQINYDLNFFFSSCGGTNKGRDVLFCVQSFVKRREVYW